MPTSVSQSINQSIMQSINQSHISSIVLGVSKEVLDVVSPRIPILSCRCPIVQQPQNMPIRRCAYLFHAPPGGGGPLGPPGAGPGDLLSPLGLQAGDELRQLAPPPVRLLPGGEGLGEGLGWHGIPCIPPGSGKEPGRSCADEACKLRAWGRDWGGMGSPASPRGQARSQAEAVQTRHANSGAGMARGGMGSPRVGQGARQKLCRRGMQTWGLGQGLGWHGIPCIPPGSGKEPGRSCADEACKLRGRGGMGWHGIPQGPARSQAEAVQTRHANMGAGVAWGPLYPPGSGKKPCRSYADDACKHGGRLEVWIPCNSPGSGKEPEGRTLSRCCMQTRG